MARVRERRQAELPTERGPVAPEFATRPYPAGGALHELEVYVVVGACAGLAPGLDHYDPVGTGWRGGAGRRRRWRPCCAKPRGPPASPPTARKCCKESRGEVAGAVHAENREARQKKLAELRTKNHDRLTSLLTDEQKAEWKKLAGPPFKGQIVFEEPEGAAGKGGSDK